jgi:hypothetical protein
MGDADYYCWQISTGTTSILFVNMNSLHFRVNVFKAALEGPNENDAT